MALRTHNFDAVSMIGEKRAPCACGKVRKRTKRFSQTLSPFNKNPDGTVKSRQDIYRALANQAEAWRAEPIRCEKCPASSGQGER